MTDQLPLGLITVHCFACPHTVERADPDAAHDAMEAHYHAPHGALLASIVGKNERMIVIQSG